ncbi:MAG: hypothetical protein H6744_18955 [Deltaproteobacteria bacterium]|nr:hypothetical protein [Deltaproteobacteria bacterium]MCB9788762.1 hypothetical protein [Deltaproteobacteria bacterium]
MSTPGFETLLVEAPGAGAGLLAPGSILRALALGAGVRAEEVGLLIPVGRGRVAVDVGVQRAAGLSTPRLLPFTEGASPALLVLRREDDPAEEDRVWLELRWPAGTPRPGPGALGAALSAATGGSIGAEAIGASFCGDGWMQLEVPERFLLALEFPLELSIRGATVTATTATGGKKKP